MVIGLVGTVYFIPSDILFYGWGERSEWLLLVRASYILIVMALLIYSFRMPGDRLSTVSILWFSATLISQIIFATNRPETHVGNSLVELIAILLVYLLLPVTVRRRFYLAVLLTLFWFFTLFFVREQPPQELARALVFAVALANLTGIIVSFRYERLDRINYYLLRAEQAATEEKTLLMQELNHRVKNNLMLTDALVRLKDDEIGPDVDLSDISARINAISVLHETLQSSDDIREIDLGTYIQTVLTTIFSFNSRPIITAVDADNVTVSTKRAVTLGLIASEVATNAIKHGFTADEPPEFNFTARHDQGSWTIIISNNGRPFPEHPPQKERGGFGTNLISILAEQIGGHLTIEGQPHPVFTIQFAAS